MYVCVRVCVLVEGEVLPEGFQAVETDKSRGRSQGSQGVQCTSPKTWLLASRFCPQVNCESA